MKQIFLICGKYILSEMFLVNGSFYLSVYLCIPTFLSSKCNIFISHNIWTISLGLSQFSSIKSFMLLNLLFLLILIKSSNNYITTDKAKQNLHFFLFITYHQNIYYLIIIFMLRLSLTLKYI